MNSNEGYTDVKDNYGNVIKRVPLDFSDPSQYTYPIQLLEDAARLWMTSGSPLPPAPNELLWRDRNWDNQVSNFRHMIEFYLNYGDRPTHMKEDKETWSDMLKEK